MKLNVKWPSLEQWKTKLIDNAMRRLPNASDYRWTDVLDYVCEHLDLDKNFDKIFVEVCREKYDTSIYQEWQHTHHHDQLAQFIAEKIIQKMEENIQKGIY